MLSSLYSVIATPLKRLPRIQASAVLDSEHPILMIKSPSSQAGLHQPTPSTRQSSPSDATPNHQPPLTIALSPSPPPVTPVPIESPTSRLDRLLSTINSVLRAYANVRYRSSTHLASLHAFQHHAHELLHGPQPPPNGRYGSKHLPKAPMLSITSAEVDKLQDDWWGSEVVAAWYGPRPGRVVPKVVVKRSSAKGREGHGGLELKRDSSHVGLYDDD